jgi:hypothetical protein
MQAPSRSKPLSRPTPRRDSRSASSQGADIWKHLLYRLKPPTQLAAGVWDAIAWLGLAIVMRLLADYGLSIMPSLWPLIAGTLVAPALIAIWLSTLFPRFSAILGYRSLLLMFGLLLGGRL